MFDILGYDLIYVYIYMCVCMYMDFVFVLICGLYLSLYACIWSGKNRIHFHTKLTKNSSPEEAS